MVMDEKYIETALKKLYNSLLFKDRVDFKVEVLINLAEDEVFYKIIVKVVIDHAKFWSDSPEYSPEYNKLINEIGDDYSDELVDLTKYFLPTENYDVWLRYEHYNTDVYEPLLKSIGDTGIGYITKFDEHRQSFEIVLDINSDKEDVVSNLDFDTDDIVIYYDDIT
jgi:hypothetical protein